MVGTQAMVTSPRLALPVSRISVSAAARSVSSRRACGRKLSPGGVNATERVLRSTSRTPRKDSRFCRRRLSAVWVMLSSPAARRKLLWSATATKACTPSTSIFMRKMHQSGN